MLNAVRLSDEIKDLSRMKDVAVQVFKMFLSDELVQHLTTQVRFWLERAHGQIWQPEQDNNRTTVINKRAIVHHLETYFLYDSV